MKAVNKKLEEYDEAYFNKGNPIVTDEEYDAVSLLVKRDTIGFPEENSVELPFEMPSLKKVSYKQNANSIRELTSGKIIENELKIIHGDKYNNGYPINCCVMSKLDGVSLLLVCYEKDDTTCKGNFYISKGRIWQLFTRGDGNHGRNVTHLISNLFKNLPLVKLEDIIAFRGEAVISKDNFDKGIFSEYKNTRNLVSGLISKKELLEEDIKLISFVDIIFFRVYRKKLSIDLIEQFSLINDNNLELVENEIIEITSYNVEYLNNLLDRYKKKSKYTIDGIVVNFTYNLSDEKMLSLMGNRKSRGYFLGAFAFKQQSVLFATEVKEIIWNVSRRGILKPIIKVDKVDVGGATIEFLSGHNAKYLSDNLIAKGAIILIKRSGDVIPAIEKIVTPSLNNTPFPDYNWAWRGVDIYPVNSEEFEILSESQKLVFFANSLKIKGIGSKTAVKVIKSLNTEEEVEKTTTEEIRKNSLNELVRLCFKSNEPFITGSVYLPDNTLNDIKDKIISSLVKNKNNIPLLISAFQVCGAGISFKKISDFLNPILLRIKKKKNRHKKFYKKLIDLSEEAAEEIPLATNEKIVDGVIRFEKYYVMITKKSCFFTKI